MTESIRDVITGELSLEYFSRRFAEGWKVASIHWIRESVEVGVLPASENILTNQPAIPFGFQITASGNIEENPAEAAILLLILDQIVREKRIQEIAAQLNSQGYSTRLGMPWTATDVFNLMPRLIEAGPSLLKSAAWQQLRPKQQSPAKQPN